jgi:hypothetical protein
VTNETDTVSVWTPHEPDDDAPWNLRRVVHLHRRVVFGACWSEIQRDLAEGPEAAVSRVMDGTVRAEGVQEGFEQLAGVIGAAAVDSGSAERLLPQHPSMAITEFSGSDARLRETREELTNILPGLTCSQFAQPTMRSF